VIVRDRSPDKDAGWPVSTAQIDLDPQNLTIPRHRTLIGRQGGEKANRERPCQTRAEASNTQLTSAFARFSKWLGGAKLTRLFMSQ
jgi:hypothetical protein